MKMEFNDVLHGLIQFSDKGLTPLLSELINSPEIHRLRNMRQMNFDVPLIQELGRSRRLPHTIGVTYLAVKLAHKSKLSLSETKVLMTAAMLHDAAIPPYGHLVESELKVHSPNFSHEKRVRELIAGNISVKDKYTDIVPGRQLELHSILGKYGVDESSVFNKICPSDNKKSAISADIDIDNIDNIHRMAVMLGWHEARINMEGLVDSIFIKNDSLIFSKDSAVFVDKWLNYRQRIYTMIIAHPECIPYNALQADMVRIAVKNKLINSQDWSITEPEFEEKLRNNKLTRVLASQLISGCEYQLIDYVWFKGFNSSRKYKNAEIIDRLHEDLSPAEEYGYFVWNEKGLISRKIKIGGEWGSCEVGSDSTSCLVALVKKTQGKPKRTKFEKSQWRKDVVSVFVSLFEVEYFDVDFPEDYRGDFFRAKNNELQLGFY
ncbi:HD domain-containing protein [Vreelandella venusta]|uniref:HD domain-containing protein n=1 Tax=Vreelandella venusta TaxID=44935 RepID=UPI003850D9AA